MNGLTWQYVLWSAALFLATFVGSIAFVAILLVSLPATYFVEDQQRDWWFGRHPLIRLLVRVAKNLAGVLLIALGIVLSLPLVPGQGLLTVLIGLMLVDFPGKRRLERKIIQRPSVYGSINRLRKRFGKPPLLLPELEAEHARDHGEP